MSNINKKLNKVIKTLNDDKLAKVGYTKFVSVTPVDNGNARRNTKLEGNEIVADYPYATKLENGYSNQAPKGMTEPTIEFIRQYVYKQTGVKI
tara:strand:+ start:487 stop:765 length:279 start_codon:yes stop_codon:yes gene_type:complete